MKSQPKVSLIAGLLVLVAILTGLMCRFAYQPQFDGAISLQSGGPGLIGKAGVLFFGRDGTTAVIAVINDVFDKDHQQLPPVIVTQRVDVGHAFPTQDKVYRVIGMGKSGSHMLLYVDAQPVEVPGYTITPGSVCIPFDSRCHLDAEKICFDVEAIKPDDTDRTHIGGCWVLIPPANAMRGWSRDRAAVDSRRVFAQPGRQLLLDSNNALELIQIVPRDEERKIGGWVEFRLLHGEEIIKEDPNVPTT